MKYTNMEFKLLKTDNIKSECFSMSLHPTTTKSFRVLIFTVRPKITNFHGICLMHNAFL